MAINSISEKKINFHQIKKAIYYSKKYHFNQKRDSGEPYFSHPIEVAYMVSDYLFDTVHIVTSILHDVIEDTPVTKEQIKLLFGPIVAKQVEDLTRVKQYGKISSQDMVTLLLNQQKYDVLIIKYFDRMHNMQSITAKSPLKRQQTIDETVNIFFSLGETLKIKAADQNLLINLCYNTTIQ